MHDSRFLVSLAISFVLACGGAIAPDGSTGSTTDPPRHTGEDGAKPPSPGIPETPAPAPGEQLPPKLVVDKPEVSGDTRFALVLKNTAGRQTMNVEIALDGRRVIWGGLAPRESATINFNLDPGEHSLTVVATETNTSLANKEAFTFSIVEGRATWGLLDISWAECDPCSPPFFSYKTQTTRPGP